MFVLAALVASVLVAGDALTPARSEPSLQPAWSAGQADSLGTGRTTGTVTVSNQSCPWTGCADTNSVEPFPVPVADVYDFKAVAAGAYHSVGLRSDGTVWAWGSAIHAQIGTAVNALRPNRIAISDVTSIAAGGSTSLALKSDGSVWAWGRNTHGELGNGTVDSDNHPTPTKVSLVGVYTAIAVNDGHALAVRNDGTLWSWGDNYYGQVGTGNTRTTPVPTPVQVKGLAGVRGVGAGWQHSFAIRNDGTLWAWGRNQAGALGDGTTTDRASPVLVVGVPDAVQVGGAFNTSIALDATGRVWTWGEGGYGESGRPGAQPGSPPLPSTTPTLVPSIGNVKMIYKTAQTTFAVKTDGTAWAWGLNSVGQLGVGDLSYCIYPNSGYPVRCKNVPTQIPGMLHPRSIAGSESAMIASNGGSVIPPASLAGQALTRSMQELLGFRLGQGTMADPVDTSSGNFVHGERDLVPQNGAYEMHWDRTYNSRSTTGGPLGPAWTTSFSERIVTAGADAVLVQADGRSARYTGVPGGGFTRPADEFGDLAMLADGRWQLSWFDGQVWTFDTAGRLERKANWAGETAVATYDAAGMLSRIDGSSGASLVFTYEAGRLVDVATGDGRHATYSYEGGLLARASSASRGTTTYTHDAAGRLAVVTDATGKNVVTNEYDAAGRVVIQSTGGAGTTTFVYEEGAGLTRATDQATGQTITYTHDAAGRLRAVFDPTGAIAANTYDGTTGYVTAKRTRLDGIARQAYDNRGNPTTAIGADRVTRSAGYDAKNRVLTMSDPTSGNHSFVYTGDDRVPTTVTDAAGKTTSYEVIGGLVTKKVDPDGVATSFEYDAARRMTARTIAPGTSVAATTSFTYDAAGRLLTETGPLGRTTTYTYDDAGRLTARTDPLNRATTYAYDAAGRLLTTTDPAGGVTTNTYDGAGRVVTTASPRGLVTRFTYDGLGQRTSTDVPGPGPDRTTTFGPMGRAATTVDEAGRTSTYSYDSDGNVTAVADPTGAVSSTSFDIAGRMTAAVDPLGRTTSETKYDSLGRVASTTGRGGQGTTYTYDVVGRTTRATDARGGATETTYTDAGRVRSITAADGVTTTNTYDAAGRLWKESTPAGATIHEYDLVGRKVRTTTPAGLFTSQAYDAAGQLLHVTDPGGVVTTYTYTQRGEIATETRSGDGTISYTYDPDGNLTSAKDALGNVTTFGYDDRNRRTSQTDARGKTTSWTYNSAGQLMARTDPLGRATTYSYDVAGRLQKVTDPSGRSTTRTLDAAGQSTAVTYADNTSVSFTYDSAGRRSTATDATGTTTYSYDAIGAPTSVARPDGRVVSYAYDTAGRRTRLGLPDGSSLAYSYDNMSRVSAITPTATLADSFTGRNGAAPDTAKWGRTTASGATATVQANALALVVPNTAGAVATVASTAPATANAELSLRYRLGDITSGATFQAHLRSGVDAYWVEVANDSATVKLQRKQGATTTTLASFTSPVDTAWHGLRFRVEGADLKVRLWDGAQAEPATWNLEVNDSGVAAAGSAKLVFSRVKAGHTATVDDVVYTDLASPPVPVVTYAYDADGRVTQEGLADGARTLTWTAGRPTRLEQSVPGAPSAVGLAYDEAGRLATETTALGTISYAYDDAGRLTGVTPSTGSTTTYAYDVLGRRISSTVGSTTTGYAYDDAGQLITATAGATTTTYSYDAAGRRVGESVGSATTSYAYDGAGRLTGTTKGGTTQTWTRDVDGRVMGLATTTGSSTTNTALDWDSAGGLATPVAVAGEGTTTLVGADGPSAIRRGAGSAGLAVDGHGSILATPSTASVARASGYDAFGAAAGQPATGLYLGYRGEVTIDSLVHLRAREYHPSTAAFTTTDPLGGVEGTPTVGYRYHYADDDPVNQTDPSGMQPGFSGFLGLDGVFYTGSGFGFVDGLFYSGGSPVSLPDAAHLAVGGAAAAGAAARAGGVAAGAGVSVVGGVAVFGTTTGIDLPDLPGPLPNLPKLCELWCDSLERARQDADDAQRNMIDGFARHMQTAIERSPENIVVLYRGMDREARSDGTWKRTSFNRYKRQIDFRGRGVSFFEPQGIEALSGKRAMFPVLVSVPGGASAKQQGRSYFVLGPTCRAFFTPTRQSSFHWDVDCGGEEATKQELGFYGYMLFNPPLPNPAYGGN